MFNSQHLSALEQLLAAMSRYHQDKRCRVLMHLADCTRGFQAIHSGHLP
jgi:hypothetical protein